MIKLMATDMDGTFLRQDMSYDDVLFARLHAELQRRGIRWVVASGNQYFQLRSFFQAYPDTIYVAENGAYIRDSKQIYALNAFTPAAVQMILPVVQALPDVKLLVCGQKSAYALTTTDPAHVAAARHYYHQLKVIDSFDQIDDQILKFALTCPPEQTQALVDHLRAALTGVAEPTSSGHGDIDVIQPGMNKAAGLQILGDTLGIALADMGAFGDGGNDLEMIRKVGMGVAMANAQLAVKAVADAITTTNEAQGVLQFIDDWLAVPQ
jgi:Cof subfamily protein (haloacid dehalogenase superfamily)